MNGFVKQRVKQMVRRTIGEPYVGKRLKLRGISRKLRGMQLSPRRILDAGTEDATFAYWLADRYPAASVTAVDIDQDAIAACRAALPRRYAGRVRFAATPFAALQPETYDLIIAFDVLEHIEDDLSAARDLARALRPAGDLLVHVPRDQWTTLSGVVHRVADHDAWQINPGHVRQGYSPDSIRDLLVEAGLQVRETETWLGKWGTLAHAIYARLEHPLPLRLVTIPVTDVCAALDGRHTHPAGNTVFARAVKPRMI